MVKILGDLITEALVQYLKGTLHNFLQLSIFFFSFYIVAFLYFTAQMWCKLSIDWPNFVHFCACWLKTKYKQFGYTVINTPQQHLELLYLFPPSFFHSIVIFFVMYTHTGPKYTDVLKGPIAMHEMSEAAA